MSRLEYKWVVAVVMVIGLFMELLDMTIVNVALPGFAKDFNADATTIQWIVTAYLLDARDRDPLERLGGRPLRHEAHFHVRPHRIHHRLALLRPCPERGATHRLSSAPGRRRRHADPGRHRDALPRVSPERALEGIRPARHPRFDGASDGPGGRRLPRRVPVLALDLPHQYPHWPRRPRESLLSISTSIASRPRSASISPASSSLALAWLRCCTVSPRRALAASRTLGRSRSCHLGLVLLVAFVFVELRTTQPMLNVRLFTNRLFAANNAVQFVALAGMSGVLFVLPLFLQAERGLTPLIRAHDISDGHRRADVRPHRRPHVPAHRSGG